MQITKGRRAGARQWALAGHCFGLDDPDQYAVVGNEHKFRAMAWDAEAEEYKVVARLAEAEEDGMEE